MVGALAPGASGAGSGPGRDGVGGVGGGRGNIVLCSWVRHVV